MHNRRNTMRKKTLPWEKSNPKQFKQIPKLVREDIQQPSKIVTNNKLTKKVARLLVAGLIILIIISIVIIATVIS